MAGKRSVSFLHWWFLLALVASLGYLFITRYYLSGLFPEDGDIGSVLSLENEFLECQTKDRQNEGVPHFIIVRASYPYLSHPLNLEAVVCFSHFLSSIILSLDRCPKKWDFRSVLFICSSPGNCTPGQV